MAAWIIEILDSNGQKQTVRNYYFAEFEEILNGIGNFTIVVPSNSAASFAQYLAYQKSNAGGNEQGLVYFTNPDSFIEHKGKVDSVEIDDKGNLVLSGEGTLSFAKRNNLINVNRSSENNGVRGAYIIDTVVNSYYNIVSGTIDAFSGNPLAAVYYEYNSCFQAFDNMTVLECDQDYFVKYTATIGGDDTVEVRDNAGSSTSIGTFVEGSSIREVSNVQDTDSIMNAITVLGAVVGGVLISATATDATSIAKYGRREPSKPVVNKNIESTTAATDYATSLLANLKDPRRYVSFRLIGNKLAEDPDTATRTAGHFALGDSLVVTAPSAQLSSVALRLISYKRIFYPDGTNLLYFNCINDGLRYKRSPYDVSSKNRDGAAIGGSSTTALHGHSADGSLITALHPHGDGTLVTALHPHGDGTYGADTHPHGSSGITTTGAGGVSYVVSNEKTVGTTTITNAGTWYTFWDMGTPTGTANSGLILHANFVCEDSRGLLIRLRNSTDGTYYPDSVGVFLNLIGVGDNSGQSKAVFIDTGANIASKYFYLEVNPTSTGATDVYWDATYSIKGLHTHPVSGSADTNSTGVSGSSGETSPDVSGSSGETSPDVSGSTDTQAPSNTITGLYAEGSAD